MDDSPEKKNPSNFQRFFLRGLAFLLPTILTIWILVAVYQFVNQAIAEPINAGVREVILTVTSFPIIFPDQLEEYQDSLSPDERARWRAEGGNADWLKLGARRAELKRWWKSGAVGEWAVLDLIGLVVAIVLIYIVGAVFGSFVGRQLYRRGEETLRRLPLFRQVYPHVKQVTDFLFGGTEEKKKNFSKVVAVEYPRKGLWSVGLVTGDTMQSIQSEARDKCLTVFIPSSPTPFTGYVITVPAEDTIDLAVSIDDALRFTVSGGVIIPPSQLIEGAATKEVAGEVPAVIGPPTTERESA